MQYLLETSLVLWPHKVHRGIWVHYHWYPKLWWQTQTQVPQPFQWSHLLLVLSGSTGIFPLYQAFLWQICHLFVHQCWSFQLLSRVICIGKSCFHCPSQISAASNDIQVNFQTYGKFSFVFMIFKYFTQYQMKNCMQFLFTRFWFFETWFRCVLLYTQPCSSFSVTSSIDNIFFELRYSHASTFPVLGLNAWAITTPFIIIHHIKR